MAKNSIILRKEEDRNYKNGKKRYNKETRGTLQYPKIKLQAPIIELLDETTIIVFLREINKTRLLQRCGQN